MKGKDDSDSDKEKEKLDAKAEISGDLERTASSKQTSKTKGKEQYERNTRKSIFGERTEETVKGERDVTTTDSSQSSSRANLHIYIYVFLALALGSCGIVYKVFFDASRSRTLIVKWRAAKSTEQGKAVLLDPISPSVKNVRNDAPITKSIDRNRLRFEYPKDSDEVRLEFTFQDFLYSPTIKIPKQDRATVMLEDGKVIVTEGE